MGLFSKIKNMFKEPIKNAVVKLIEISFDKDGRKKRLPVSHTFTDKYGEFVFGPLCPGKEYALEIFVNDVKHVKICAKGKIPDGNCLKGIELDKCDKKIDHDDFRDIQLPNL